MDGQVCFHRRSFADPVKPQWSITGSMGPLMGTNKAAWDIKLLLMTVLASYVTELVIKTLAIRLLYLCCESGISTVGHQRARVA